MTTLNTKDIIKQTDGMDTNYIDVAIDKIDGINNKNIDIEESRASDDEIYDTPHTLQKIGKDKDKKNKNKKKKKKNKTNKKIKNENNNNNDDEDERHIHTQSMNMEESHDREQSSRSLTGNGYSFIGRNNTILSDHNTYPSIPSISNMHNIQNYTNSTNIYQQRARPIQHQKISSTPQTMAPSSLATSYIYENCATPDGYVFNQTVGLGALHRAINPDIDPNINSNININQNQHQIQNIHQSPQNIHNILSSPPH